MAVLVRTRGTHNGKWVFHLKDCTVLGRHPECDISELFQAVGGVSRHHAEVRRVGDQYVIEDKGSRNGTLLNGQRVTGTVPLRDGDRIDICQIELTFCADGGSSSGSGGTLDVPLVTEPPDQARPLKRRSMEPPSPPAGLAGYTAEKLHALAHMLTQLGRSLDVDQTLRELLTGLFAIFPQAERGVHRPRHIPPPTRPRGAGRREPNDHRHGPLPPRGRALVGPAVRLQPDRLVEYGRAGDSLVHECPPAGRGGAGVRRGAGR